jgi:hypothetical protein
VLEILTNAQYETVKDRETPESRAAAVRNAVDEYAQRRSFGAEKEADVDEWRCSDSAGHPLVRWGFYPEHRDLGARNSSRKRNASQDFEKASKRARSGRKVSISRTMISFDTPSDDFNDLAIKALGDSTDSVTATEDTDAE